MIAKIGDTGTLAELGVKVGDVVQYHCPGWSAGKKRTILSVSNGKHQASDSVYGKTACDENGPYWCLISRATPEAETPPLWRDMTDAEKGALLLAWHEGKVIDVWVMVCGFEEWVKKNVGTDFHDHMAYRIKPAESVVREPREFWITSGPLSGVTIFDVQPATMLAGEELIHVREVL